MMSCIGQLDILKSGVNSSKSPIDGTLPSLYWVEESNPGRSFWDQTAVPDAKPADGFFGCVAWTKEMKFHCVSGRWEGSRQRCILSPGIGMYRILCRFLGGCKLQTRPKHSPYHPTSSRNVRTWVCLKIVYP